MTLDIEYRSVSELVPYANNSRIHTSEQVDTICESIKAFGFNDPVGVWTNQEGQLEIVEGHGRILAAEQLGIDKVPTINLDHLSDEERRAYAIAHNQTGDNSSWDFAILDAEIESLDFDFEAFGLDISVDFDAEHERELPDLDEKEHAREELVCPCCGAELARGANGQLVERL